MLGWLLAPALAQGPFAACDAMSEPTPREHGRCVYMAARQSGDFATAEARLAAADDDPWALLNLAHVYAAVGRDEAESTYRRAVAGLSEQPAGQVSAWLGLRALWTHQGRFDEAREALDEARAAAGTEPELVARVDGETARFLWRRGDNEAAVRIAGQIDLEGAEHQLKVLVLHVLAGAHLELGRVHASWSYSERLVQLTAASGDTYVEATARLNALEMLADHPELSVVDRATFARQTLEVAERGGNPWAIVGASCHVGQLEGDIERLRRCLEQGRELDEPAIVNHALTALAQLAPDAPTALAHLQEAERAAAEVALRFTVARTQHERAAALWRDGRRDDSDEAAEEAVRTVEAIRDTHGSELAKAGFATIWRTAWLAPAARWLAADNVPRAWAWAERMRARQLLAERLDVVADAEAKQKVESLQEELWDDMSGEARSALLNRLADAEAASRVQLTWASLPDIQQRLGADEAMIVYVMADEPAIDSWAWVVQPDAVHTVPLPEPQALEAPISLVLGLDVVPPAASQSLHDAVLSDALALTTARHLVIVPDGPLHRLPWGLLAPEGVAVSVVPSATMWHGLPVGQPREGVLSLADPGDQGLPYSRAESATWVGALGGVQRLGAEATLASLVPGLADHDILHIATHAEVDDNLGHHRLVLADGALTPEVAATLPLDGKVVALAACQGADGPVFAAEGAISLARSFLQAGARAVVASTVPLRDDQAAALFGDIAREWAKGARLDEAVANVQAVPRHEGVAHMSWGGLMVLGDGRVTAIAPPPSRAGAALVSFAGALLVALLCGLWAVRRGSSTLEIPSRRSE